MMNNIKEFLFHLFGHLIEPYFHNFLNFRIKPRKKLTRGTSA